MALQDIKLPRLDTFTQLVDKSGVSSITFSQWWNSVADQLEAGVNSINQALNDAAAAQAAADDAQGTADGAQTSADTAQGSADTAQTSADTAQSTADGAVADAAAAQATANAANTLAGTKVTKDVGASWSAPSGTVSRGSLASYTAPVAAVAYDPVQMQAVMDGLQATSRASVAIITDLRANHALTP